MFSALDAYEYTSVTGLGLYRHTKVDAAAFDGWFDAAPNVFSCADMRKRWDDFERSNQPLKATDHYRTCALYGLDLDEHAAEFPNAGVPTTARLPSLETLTDKANKLESNKRFSKMYAICQYTDLWRKMTPRDQALYMIVCTRHNGSNNGSIVVVYSELAYCSNMNLKHVTQSMNNLDRLGLLRIKKNQVSPCGSRVAVIELCEFGTEYKHPTGYVTPAVLDWFKLPRTCLATAPTNGRPKKLKADADADAS